MLFRFASNLFFFNFKLIASIEITTEVQLTGYKKGFKIFLIDVSAMPKTHLYSKFYTREKK